MLIKVEGSETESDDGYEDESEEKPLNLENSAIGEGQNQSEVQSTNYQAQQPQQDQTSV